MTHLRLRTQLFIATLLIIVSLAAALTAIIHHTLAVETDREVREATDDSVRAFENVQRQREQQLSRTAAMLAEIPTLKAQMTSADAPTIQDASRTFWKLAGSDLFILAMPNREIVALHMTKPGWPPEAAARELERSVEQGDDASWWYESGRLYWVFIRPITAGRGGDSQELGLLAIGYQMDSSLAEQIAQAAGNQIALTTGDTLIASTLPQRDEEEMKQLVERQELNATNSEEREITLRTESYAVSSVLLHGALPSPVRCYVLMPLTPENNFLKRINGTIFILGASAVVLGALVFGFVSRAITKPLDTLVAGVRALAAGDYTYSVTPRGASEVAELSKAFAKMRGELLASQQRQIETERIAALGRAASSISHDLRHYLAAVVANAEFLYEAEELNLDKSEIYQEIKTASNQMTDLIDSLRELSYPRATIAREPANLDEIIHRAIEAVRVRAEFRSRTVRLESDGDMEGMFDARKLERAFFNLVLNACEATEDGEREVTVHAMANGDGFEVRVSDEGRGIPEGIRDCAFDPFVSSGKPNGTGLGLAIVSKIVSEHGGSATLERTSESGTVMLVKLPRCGKTAAEAKDSALRKEPK